MASGIFAKIGNIKGESLDSKHKDEIEVLSWSWGVQQSGTMAHGGGGGEGKASFNDFNFTHHVDKGSAVLLKACATGEHIKEATITVRKAGKANSMSVIRPITRSVQPPKYPAAIPATDPITAAIATAKTATRSEANTPTMTREAMSRPN